MGKWRIDIGEGWIGALCGASVTYAMTGEWKFSVVGAWLGAWASNKLRG